MVIVSWLLIITSANAIGQSGADIAVLNAGVGARPLAMGGAFTAVADNADAPYWNPAGLGFISSQEITSSQTRLSTDADHYYLSYVTPALGGTIGLSWIQVGLGNIAQTSSEVDIHNEVQNISLFSYFSSAYLLSYGKKLNDHIAFGLTAKYLSSEMFGISGGSGWGYSLTPGIMLRLDPCHLTLGLKIDELINTQQWGTGTVENVPPKARLGLSWLPWSESRVAVDISQTVKSGYSPEVVTGFEWAQGGIAYRAGYNSSGLTAGVGFTVGHARLDYGYVQDANFSSNNVHRISLSGIW
ncbi:MAG: PorV/PorQ family protein [Candidatus Margulisiibacteriota bacterium]